NLQNQMMILKSRDLTEETLKTLPYGIDYYYKTLRNNLPIYPDIAVSIVPGDDLPLPKDIEFSITSLGNNMFILKSESKLYSFEKTSAFGQPIEVSGKSFSIECWNEDAFLKDKNKQIFFTIYSMNRLVNYYSNRL